MKRITWLYICGLSLITTAQAASFDCGKAATKVEKLICGNAELSKLDEDLSAAYKTALQDAKQAGSIKQAQKQWVNERNECKDAVCVKRAYEMRLSFIRSDASVSVASLIEAYDNDYERDFSAKTYLPAHISSQDGEPYELRAILLYARSI